MANFFLLSVLSSIKDLILLVVVVAVVVECGVDGVTSVQIAVLVVAVLGGRICRPVLPVGGIAVLDVNAGRVAGAVLGGVVVVLLHVFGHIDYICKSKVVDLDQAQYMDKGITQSAGAR